MERDPTQILPAYLSDSPEEVLRIRTSMIEAARPYLVEEYFDDLGVVVRLTVEFYFFLQRDWRSFDAQGLTYLADSILCGTEFFASAASAYRGVAGSRIESLEWGLLSSFETLRDRFISGYREFLVEANFERRLKQLLDLYKLQIVFAGMIYG